MIEARRIPWRETAGLIEELGSVGEIEAARSGVFRIRVPGQPSGFVLRPAACLPEPLDDEEASAWLRRQPDATGNEWVILLQAGAAAVGFWGDGHLVDSKVFKRYVIRGNGRAQPTHLRVKGKSRYGSRLRLQQAEALLRDLCDRIGSWDEQDGPADTIHWSCAPRLWDDLLAHDAPAAPFTRHDPRLRRIRVDVHVPGEDELLRIRRILDTTTLEAERTRTS